MADSGEKKGRANPFVLPSKSVSLFQGRTPDEGAGLFDLRDYSTSCTTIRRPPSSVLSCIFFPSVSSIACP